MFRIEQSSLSSSGLEPKCHFWSNVPTVVTFMKKEASFHFRLNFVWTADSKLMAVSKIEAFVQIFIHGATKKNFSSFAENVAYYFWWWHEWQTNCDWRRCFRQNYDWLRAHTVWSNRLGLIKITHLHYLPSTLDQSSVGLCFCPILVNAS